MIKKIEDKNEKQDICEKILKLLPEWFEMPESIRDYATNCRELPLWVEQKEEEIRGLISLKETSDYTVEVYVMGVLKAFHREGIGRKLFEVAYEYAKEKGYEFVQVKTVQMGKYPDYDKTNSFYKGVGFRELECLPLWDEANPCQVYVMSVK